MSVSYPVLKYLKETKNFQDIQITKWLSPSVKDLSNPLEIKLIKKIVNFFKRIRKTNKKIFIYGDYDVDGITSTVLLFKHLKILGFNVIGYYIPHRRIEGYGLSLFGLKEGRDKGAEILISVDCGVNSNREIFFAYKLGYKYVIVIDHHIIKEDFEGDFLLHPKFLKLGDLSSVGLVFKFLEGLYKILNRDLKELYWDLDLVVLGSIADIVPIENENRILTCLGLKVLNKSKNKGLNILKEVSGLNNTFIGGWHISFILAPRLNASGRVSHAKYSFDLLLAEKSEEQLYEIAKKLDKFNRYRQGIVESILTEIFEGNFDKDGVIVAWGENWHEGVLGIVASRLVEEFNKPAIILKREGSILKGSARSVPGFNLIESFEKISYLLNRFGGHSMACGLELPFSNVKKFKDKLNELFEKNSLESNHAPKINVEIKLKDITLEVLKDIRKLEPFGLGNPEPVFLTRDLTVVSSPKVVADKHLKFRVIEDEKTYFDVIAFNKGSYIDKIKTLTKIDLWYNIRPSEWSKSGIELKAVDFQIKNL